MLLLLHRAFVAVPGLSLVASGGCLSLARSGVSCFRTQALALSLRSAQSQECSVSAALGCSGCSRWGSWAPEHTGLSSCGLWALEHRLRSCGAWVYLLYGMWNLPSIGMEPRSPALADGFHQGSPAIFQLKTKFLINLFILIGG